MDLSSWTSEGGRGKATRVKRVKNFVSNIKGTYLFPYILCLVYDGRYGCSSQAMKPGACLYIGHLLRLLTPNITCRTSGGCEVEWPIRAKVINTEESFLEDRDNLFLLRVRNEVIPIVFAHQHIPELVLSGSPMAKGNERKWHWNHQAPFPQSKEP